MAVTINEDELLPKEEHIVVYGANGWTDSLDAATVNLLLDIGAVAFHAAYSGPGFESRIYVSVKGRGPQ